MQVLLVHCLEYIMQDLIRFVVVVIVVVVVDVC